MSEEKKAYDFKRLAELAKAEGLEVVEDAAESLYKVVRTWFVESAVISKTPLDNLVIPFLNEIDKLALPAIDNINPADNEPAADSE